MYIAADHRIQRIVTHADTNQIPLRSAKKNTSHKHARMESKLVTQTSTGQNRHKDAFITFVTQTCHTDSSLHVTRHVNQIVRESADHKTRESHGRETKVDTYAGTKFVTQTRKLNLSPRRKTKVVTQTRKLRLSHRRETQTCNTDGKLNSSQRR